MHSGLKAAAVKTGQCAGHFVGKEGVMPGRDQQLRHAPDILLRGHPVEGVEAFEVHGLRVIAQGSFAAQVVIKLEVAERELAQGAIDGRAKAQACEVRLGDGAPEATFAIESHNVIVVAHGFEIHEQWRMTMDAEGGGSQQCAFKAMAFALAQRALRGAGCVSILVLERIDELLDLFRRLQGAQRAEALRREAVGRAGAALRCGA